MFEALKKAVGFGSAPEETWECNPLVIVDERDEVTWSAPATVIYVPGKEKYEGGVGVASTPDGLETILEFKLVKIQHRDPLGIEFPLGALMPWGQSGVTVSAIDSDGNELTIHTNGHAASFLKNRSLGGEPVDASSVE